MPLLGTIKGRLAFLVALLVLLMAGLVVISVTNLGIRSVNEMRETSVRLQESALLVEWEEKAKALTALLAAQSVQPASEIDYFVLNSSARLVLEGRDVRYVYILDDSARVLADGTKTLESVGTVLSDAITNRAMVANEVLIQRQANFIDVSSPVELGSARLATVRIGFSTDRLRETINRQIAGVGETMTRISKDTVRDTLLWALLVSFSVLAFGYVFVGRAVSSPLGELVRAARRIGSGDLSHRLDVGPTKNELSELGTAFNDMAGRLREANKNLEQRVEERTRELTDEITERKRAEEERHLALIEAERANMAKTEFLANMSHELHTPLNAIVGFSDLLKEEVFGPLGNSKYVTYANDIKQSSLHLLELISDILEFSKVEVGRVDLNEDAVDVGKTVDACMRMVEERSLIARVALNREVSDGLPRLHADPRRVKQILINLLTNAIKFTPANGQVVVEAGVDEEGGIMLTVKDTGVGIASENISRMLEPFEQGKETLTGNYDGTGLGLAVVKSLTELHGGTLKVKSEPGAGTSVTVAFPPDRTLL